MASKDHKFLTECSFSRYMKKAFTSGDGAVKSAAWLAQWRERRSDQREVADSNPNSQSGSLNY